jgi:hypothetical protein
MKRIILLVRSRLTEWIISLSMPEEDTRVDNRSPRSIQLDTGTLRTGGGGSRWLTDIGEELEVPAITSVDFIRTREDVFKADGER